MIAKLEDADVSVVAALARHLALSPVAFAVTEGAGHTIRYANAAFRRLQAEGAIAIRESSQPGSSRATNLTPLLDRAFRGVESIKDEPLAGTYSGDGAPARWRCTAWPISTEEPVLEGLVVEVRDAEPHETAWSRQRAIAERLLLGALREQDSAREASEASRRATFLAAASRDLAMSLDQEATHAAVQRRSLPRDGAWCIVDIIEPDGIMHRLAVVHPDPAKQAIAQTLADRWHPSPDDPIGAPSLTRAGVGEPRVITHDSGDALVAAAHGPENLAILRTLGFGALLVVPLVVRAAVIGAITFVTRDGDPPFSPAEIALASDLADRCAMALDNARLYRETDVLRVSADVANRAKSTFLGNISHELRTPLNAIGGYADLLDMGLRGPVTPEQRNDLARIKHNQQHLLLLITEILNFVRTESGRTEYHFTSVSVSSVLDDVVDMLEGAVKARGLVLDREPDSAGAMVWADSDRVRQIMVNLVMNAVKYTPTGGGPITVSSSQTRDAVMIHVTDSGPGIPGEMLETIFEPFVQLANGLTNRQGGIGLGLAISRDLARAMRGSLTAASTLGAGSRFTLTLPRAAATEIAK